MKTSSWLYSCSWMQSGPRSSSAEPSCSWFSAKGVGHQPRECHVSPPGPNMFWPLTHSNPGNFIPISRQLPTPSEDGVARTSAAMAGFPPAVSVSSYSDNISGASGSFPCRLNLEIQDPPRPLQPPTLPPLSLNAGTYFSNFGKTPSALPGWPTSFRLSVYIISCIFVSLGTSSDSIPVSLQFGEAKWLSQDLWSENENAVSLLGWSFNDLPLGPLPPSHLREEWRGFSRPWLTTVRRAGPGLSDFHGIVTASELNCC